MNDEDRSIAGTVAAEVAADSGINLEIDLGTGVRVSPGTEEQQKGLSSQRQKGVAPESESRSSQTVLLQCVHVAQQIETHVGRQEPAERVVRVLEQTRAGGQQTQRQLRDVDVRVVVGV